MLTTASCSVNRQISEVERSGLEAVSVFKSAESLTRLNSSQVRVGFR